MSLPLSKTDYRSYLQPETVSRLGRLDLIARLVVDGFITGLHRSPYHGFSVEFSEYRACVPGEAVRHIDWKILARTERYYRKLFEEETNVRAHILLDCSASMEFTSGTLSKFQYARYLAAALTHLMLKQRDAVGLVTYNDELKSYVPPRSVPSTLHTILGQIHNAVPRGLTCGSRIFHHLSERITRRGLIIILSDLLENPDDIISGLKHLRHRKHEVIVFHILDPAEKSLDFKSDSLFIDLESRKQIQANPWHVRKHYTQKFESYINRLKAECRNLRIDYVHTLTSEPFDTALFRYLAGRKRIGG